MSRYHQPLASVVKDVVAAVITPPVVTPAENVFTEAPAPDELPTLPPNPAPDEKVVVEPSPTPIVCVCVTPP